MSLDKHKQIYDTIKHMASQHKIKILIPEAGHINSHEVQYNMPYSKNIISMANNVISVSRDKSAISIDTVIMKTRKLCEITEYIKAKDEIGLKNYLTKTYEDEKDIQSRKSVYDYKFLNNFAYLLTNKTEDSEKFFHILENSQLFKEVISNSDSFWIKVAFEIEDYSFLRKKVPLDNILKYEDLQNFLKYSKSQHILEQLLKEPCFIDYLENNLKIIQFIGIKQLTHQNEEDCFTIILHHINMKNPIDLEKMYQQYTMSIESVDKDSLHFKWFNDTIKKIILYSNYNFSKEDKTLEVLSEENQQLITKKILNTILHKNLVAKDKLKRPKI